MGHTDAERGRRRTLTSPSGGAQRCGPSGRRRTSMPLGSPPSARARRSRSPTTRPMPDAARIVAWRLRGARPRRLIADPGWRGTRPRPFPRCGVAHGRRGTCFTPATELARLIRAKSVLPSRSCGSPTRARSAQPASVPLIFRRLFDVAIWSCPAAESGGDAGERLPLHGIPTTIKDVAHPRRARCPGRGCTSRGFPMSTTCTSSDCSRRRDHARQDQ